MSGVSNDGQSMADINWYNASGTAVDWNNGDQSLTCLLATQSGSENLQHATLLMQFNASSEDRVFQLPSKAKPFTWRTLIDTAAESPADIFAEENGPILQKDSIKLLAHSLRCFASYDHVAVDAGGNLAAR